MQETVTYLEMLDPSELNPAAPKDVALEPATPETHRALNLRIGAQHQWDTVDFSESDWAAYLSDPQARTYVIKSGSDDAGLARFVLSLGDVEITTFGLVPEHIGRGIGAYALTLTIQKAWSFNPRRVWLHTSTLDHPNALPNYQKRGLHPFHTETRQRDAR